jgi:hypothetical protein
VSPAGPAPIMATFFIFLLIFVILEGLNKDESTQSVINRFNALIAIGCPSPIPDLHLFSQG